MTPVGKTTDAGWQVGTTVTFHQEHMADAEERERQRDHWREVLDRIFPEGR